MKTIIGLIACTLAANAFAGDVYVQGYTRQDGTYVQPHHRTTPDNTLQNNYSAQGNFNPYTGQAGTLNPYPQQQIYVQPAPIYQPPPAYRQPANSYFQQAPLPPQRLTPCPIGVYTC